MELRLAILGGVIPATVLGILMLVASALTRPGRAPVPDTTPPEPTAPRTTLALPTILWTLGFAVGAALIHFASWSWPRVWPPDATYRFLHTSTALSIWGLIDVGLGLGGGRHQALVTPVRWVGRGAVIAGVLGVLGGAYIKFTGWPMLAGVVSVGVGLTLVAVLTVERAQRNHHPSLVWGVQFLAALGAFVVLILGRTATAAQASAGLAALAAATAVASLIARRSTPGPVAGLLWSGSLAWLLVVGCVATGKTNLASAAILLAAPWGLALPRRRLDVDLFWKRVPLTLVIGLAWGVLCIASAMTLAALTQAPEPEPYAY